MTVTAEIDLTEDQDETTLLALAEERSDVSLLQFAQLVRVFLASQDHWWCSHGRLMFELLNIEYNLELEDGSRIACGGEDGTLLSSQARPGACIECLAAYRRAKERLLKDLESDDPEVEADEESVSAVAAAIADAEAARITSNLHRVLDELASGRSAGEDNPVSEELAESATESLFEALSEPQLLQQNTSATPKPNLKAAVVAVLAQLVGRGDCLDAAADPRWATPLPGVYALLASEDSAARNWAFEVASGVGELGEEACRAVVCPVVERWFDEECGGGSGSGSGSGSSGASGSIGSADASSAGARALRWRALDHVLGLLTRDAVRALVDDQTWLVGQCLEQLNPDEDALPVAATPEAAAAAAARLAQTSAYRQLRSALSCLKKLLALLRQDLWGSGACAYLTPNQLVHALSRLCDRARQKQGTGPAWQPPTRAHEGILLAAIEALGLVAVAAPPPPLLPPTSTLSGEGCWSTVDVVLRVLSLAQGPAVEPMSAVSLAAATALASVLQHCFAAGGHGAAAGRFTVLPPPRWPLPSVAFWAPALAAAATNRSASRDGCRCGELAVAAVGRVLEAHVGRVRAAANFLLGSAATAGDVDAAGDFGSGGGGSRGGSGGGSGGGSRAAGDGTATAPLMLDDDDDAIFVMAVVANVAKSGSGGGSGGGSSSGASSCAAAAADSNANGGGGSQGSAAAMAAAIPRVLPFCNHLLWALCRSTPAALLPVELAGHLFHAHAQLSLLPVGNDAVAAAPDAPSKAGISRLKEGLRQQMSDFFHPYLTGLCKAVQQNAAVSPVWEADVAIPGLFLALAAPSPPMLRGEILRLVRLSSGCAFDDDDTVESLRSCCRSAPAPKGSRIPERMWAEGTCFQPGKHADT